MYSNGSVFLTGHGLLFLVKHAVASDLCWQFTKLLDGAKSKVIEFKDGKAT